MPTSVASQQISALGNGLSGALASMISGLQSGLGGEPLFGGNPANAATASNSPLGAVTALQKAIQARLAQLPVNDSFTTAQVAQAINSALQSAGFAGAAVVSIDASGNLSLAFANTSSGGTSQTLNSALGASQLSQSMVGLNVSGSADLNISTTLNLAVGVSSAGAFSTTQNGDALSVSMQSTGVNFGASTKVGFLPFATTNNGSTFSGAVTVNSAGAVASSSGSGNFAVNLSAALGSAAFPSVTAGLAANWSQGANTGNVPFAFSKVSANYGHFFNNFLRPALGNLKTFLTPLQQIATILTTDLTPFGIVKGKLDKAGAIVNGKDAPDGKATLIDLLKLESPNTNFAPLVRAINLVNSLYSLANFFTTGRLGQQNSYALGSFSITPNQLSPNITGALSAAGGALRTALAGAGGAAGLLSALQDPGLSFPILSNPSALFQTILGNSKVNLFNFTVQTPTIGVGSIAPNGTPIDTKTFAVFPLWILKITLSGALQVQATVSGGFESSGLAQFANSNFQSYAAILNGLYVGGGSQPLLTLAAALKAAAGIDAGIASGSVNGNIAGQLAIYLAQTLHLNQLPTNLASLFAASGNITAGLGAEAQLGRRGAGPTNQCRAISVR
jgi:hypothetical protein